MDNVGGRRQKRVLPSRSRRGGPGIGSCDVDVMILDTQKRKAESEPLIPVGTQFLLTTNSSLVPSTPPPVELNPDAKALYFDQAEVLKAYKEQQIIQTPEFSQLSEQASVSSRFRPRGSDDETVDTSDAAYEKRHRKYETFEKRQRLREKEKLKHEQYKLKERIEQLRAMDGAAFLALPSSSFSPVPGRLTDDPEDVTSPASPPGELVNGAAAHTEGERRRKEMLDIALTLVERYSTLLRERKVLEREKKNGGMSSFREPEFGAGGRGMLTHHGDDEFDIDTDEPVAETSQEREKIKLKIPARVTKSSPQTPKSTKWQTGQFLPIPKSPSIRKSKLQGSPHAHPLSLTPVLHQFDSTSPMLFDSRQSSSVQPYTQPSASRSTTPFLGPIPNTDLRGSIISGIESVSQRPRKRKKNLAAAFLMGPEESDGHLQEPTKSTSLLNRRSTSRASVLVAPKSHASYADGRSEHTTSLLLIAAYRNADTPKARKTQRHVTAFGSKVPAELEHWQDFELPAWLLAKDDVDADGLEVESQLLADIDMDGSGDLLVDEKDVSVHSLLQRVEPGQSGTIGVQDHASVGDVAVIVDPFKPS